VILSRAGKGKKLVQYLGFDEEGHAGGAGGKRAERGKHFLSGGRCELQRTK